MPTAEFLDGLDTGVEIVPMNDPTQLIQTDTTQQEEKIPMIPWYRNWDNFPLLFLLFLIAALFIGMPIYYIVNH